MSQVNGTPTAKVLKSKAPFILSVAIAFFIYELWLLANSFPADYQIYRQVADGGFTFWGEYWLFSELVGEVGLIIRFSGAFFFLVFALMLVRKRGPNVSYLRKGVFLEAIQYFFFIPFITFLFLRPNGTLVRYEAGISYTLLLLIITPVFLMLFWQLRNAKNELAVIFKWIAIAAVSFVLALWVKHFIFSLYALPMDFQDPLLTLGFLNSALTILVAEIILVVALLPSIKKTGSPHWRLAGVGLCLVSIYFIVYVLIALTNSTYLSFLTLTELWVVTMFIAGIGFIMHKSK